MKKFLNLVSTGAAVGLGASAAGLTLLAVYETITDPIRKAEVKKKIKNMIHKIID